VVHARRGTASTAARADQRHGHDHDEQPSERHRAPLAHPAPAQPRPALLTSQTDVIGKLGHRLRSR